MLFINELGSKKDEKKFLSWCGKGAILRDFEG